ncbi:hypothetical protein KQI84_01780 [bacterium]|nr:hypothetical protein [bacterium]
MRRRQRNPIFILLCLLALIPTAMMAAPQAEALPLVHTPIGVLFRVKAPDAQSVYLAGTFNGWAGSDGYTVTDPSARMYGPDDNGVYEIFYPLTPGTHIFKYCVNGAPDGWMPGPSDLPRAKDDFDNTPGQAGLMGSSFEFSLTEPPWPPKIPNQLMRPVVLVKNTDGQPYLRVRFFSRQAKSVHAVGSWDGWTGISDRAVFDDYHKLSVTNVPHVWEGYLGPLTEGTLEFKLVVNNRQWLSDPSVLQVSQDGNSVIQIFQRNGQWYAGYTPRFPDGAQRQAEENRWGNALKWHIEREDTFKMAADSNTPLLWVITLPGSKYSQELMEQINTDPALVTELKNRFICLETPANEVQHILRKYRIFRVPYVAVFDSNMTPTWRGFNPSTSFLRQELEKVK